MKRDGSHRIYVYADEAARVPFALVDFGPRPYSPWDNGSVYYIFANQAGAPERVEDAGPQSIW